MALRTKSDLPPQRLATLNILREQVLPVFQRHGVDRLAFGHGKLHPSELPEGMNLSPAEPLGKAVKVRGRNSAILTEWRDEAMETLRFPGFCFVFEGEADIRVGNTILHCPTGNGILFPAGVPRSSGDAGHWMRPHPEKAHSDILWINFNASAAMCHHCRSRGTKHFSDYGWYSVVGDRRILGLAESLIGELEQKGLGYEAVSSAYLMAILNLLLRDLSGSPSPSPSAHASSRENDGAALPELVVERAQTYIDNHLTHHITLQDIAHASYVSRAHLAQIFRQQLGRTVWDYVTERRIEEAKAMLADTDIYIQRVAQLTGFASPTTFSARFAEITGMSPGEYRRRQKDSEAQKNTI